MMLSFDVIPPSFVYPIMGIVDGFSDSGSKVQTDFFGHLVCFELNGDDWTFASHKKIDTTPTEEDFKAVVAAYLSYRVKCLMENK